MPKVWGSLGSCDGSKVITSSLTHHIEPLVVWTGTLVITITYVNPLVYEGIE